MAIQMAKFNLLCLDHKMIIYDSSCEHCGKRKGMNTVGNSRQLAQCRHLNVLTSGIVTNHLTTNTGPGVSRNLFSTD